MVCQLTVGIHLCDHTMLDGFERSQMASLSYTMHGQVYGSDGGDTLRLTWQDRPRLDQVTAYLGGRGEILERIQVAWNSGIEG